MLDINSKLIFCHIFYPRPPSLSLSLSLCLLRFSLFLPSPTPSLSFAWRPSMSPMLGIYKAFGARTLPVIVKAVEPVCLAHSRRSSRPGELYVYLCVCCEDSGCVLSVFRLGHDFYIQFATVRTRILASHSTIPRFGIGHHPVSFLELINSNLI